MALKTGIGTGTVMIMAFLIGVGIIGGFMINQAELFHPQETFIRTGIIAEQWRLEQQRAQAQLMFEAEQHAQDLKVQAQVGAAWAETIRIGGALAVVGFTVGIVCIMSSVGWHIATRGFVFAASAKRAPSAPRPSSAPQRGVDPLRFPPARAREQHQG